MFTWFPNAPGYTVDADAAFRTLCQNQEIVEYAVVGRESAPRTGSLHYQGYVRFQRNVRFERLRRLLPGARLAIARGSPSSNRDYCTKDGDFVEFGSCPESQQGRRNDLNDLIDWGDQFIADNGRAPTYAEYARDQPVHALRHPRALEVFAARAPAPVLRQGTPNEWQDELLQELEDAPDDRKIRFYVDEAGGAGKTWLQQHYLTTRTDGQVLSLARRDDMAHSIDPSKRVFFINVPRSQMEFLNYSILEMLKDRLVYSPKYHSQMKVLHTTPHVIVFSNEMPDFNKLSQDRYEVKQLTP